MPESDSLLSGIPGFICIDHVAISVPRGALAAQVEAYRRLGFEEVHREDVLGNDQVREVLLRPGAGQSLIQLLEPLDDSSPVQKQIATNGGRGGMAHVAYRVSDINAAFAAMKAQGLNIIDPAPRRGSRGASIFFLHPKSSEASPLGYLIEVVQHNSQP